MAVPRCSRELAGFIHYGHVWDGFMHSMVDIEALLRLLGNSSNCNMPLTARPVYYASK